MEKKKKGVSAWRGGGGHFVVSMPVLFVLSSVSGAGSAAFVLMRSEIVRLWSCAEHWTLNTALILQRVVLLLMSTLLFLLVSSCSAVQWMGMCWVCVVFVLCFFSFRFSSASRTFRCFLLVLHAVYYIIFYYITLQDTLLYCSLLYNTVLYWIRFKSE